MKSEKTTIHEKVNKGEKITCLVPYKSDVFDTYVVWKSLPSFIKNPPTVGKGRIRPTRADFCAAMGIEDEKVFVLADIKSQMQFAERFGVHINTLTDWNKLINERDLLADMRSWALNLSKNVLMSLYHKAVEKGDALRVKLWFQLVNEWNEKRNAAIGRPVEISIVYNIEPKIV